MRGHDNAAKCFRKTDTLCFCRKIIKLAISVAKISTFALPGQTLEETTFLTNLTLEKYREIIAIIEKNSIAQGT